MGEKIKLKQNWCLVEDGSRVVPETDVAARWLHWIAGAEVDLDEAVRLGAVRKTVPVPPPPAKKAPAKKAAPRSHHKMAKPPDNKGGDW